MPNPFTNDDNGGNPSRGLTIDHGVVMTSPSDAKHQVVVRTGRFEASIPCKVATTAKGDVNIPPVGAHVLIGYRGDDLPVVLAHYYANPDDVPSHEDGERIISHHASDTEIALKPNGNIVIDGGGKGAIHDVETTKDADGHVTDITLKRRSDILI